MILSLIFQFLLINLLYAHKESILSFVSSLISRNFNGCDLILLHDLKREQNISNNSMTFDPKILLEDISNQDSNAYFVGSLWSMAELTSFNDIHRKSKHLCSISLILLERVTPRTTSRLFHLITRRFGAISRKNEDAYIFLTSDPSLAHSILFMDICLRIKYKIVLFPSEFTKIGAKSLCFYCNGGSPKIVAIKLEGYRGFDDIFPDFIQDFNGKALRVASPTRLTFGVEIFPSNGKWWFKRGIYFNMLKQFQRKFNTSTDWIVFPGSGGGGTGMPLKNGTWTGTAGDVLNGRADIALFTGYVLSRIKLFGFSVPVNTVRLTFSVGKPRPEFTWKSIFWSFSWEFWIGFIGISLLFHTSFSAINWASGKLVPKKVKKKGDIWGANKFGFYMLGTFLEQDKLGPKGSKERLFCAFWLFFGIVTATAYKSKLVGFLAFPVLSKIPKTFNELSDSDYEYGLEGGGIGSAAQDNIRSSTNKIYQRINGKMSLEHDPVKCFMKGVTSNFACICYRTQIEYIFMRNFSGKSNRKPFIVSSDTNYFSSGTITMEKRAIFLNNFDRIISPMVYTGIRDFWLKRDFWEVRSKRLKWEKEAGIPPLLPDDLLGGNGQAHLTLLHLKGSFLIVLSGLVVSILAFLIEFISKNRYQKSNKKRK